MRAAVTRARGVMEVVGVSDPGEPGAGEVVVRPAGRVVVVGLSGHDTPLRVGDLAFKVIDLVGVSCCTGDEFADAVALVARRGGTLRGLVTHEFPLEGAPAAIEYAIWHPAEVMKATIRLDTA